MIIDWTAENFAWSLERRRERVSITELRGATMLVAISLRNPAFSNDWIKNVIGQARRFSCKIVLTLVDTPYFESLIAQSESPDDTRAKVSDLKAQREEQASRVQRLAKQDRDIIRLRSWDALLSDTPISYKEEIHRATSQSEVMSELINLQVRKVFPLENDPEKILILSKFFRDEIPVLTHMYYEVFDGCFDVYPGPQAQFFWELDTGALATELPLLTNAAQNGRAHSYIKVTKSLDREDATRLG